MRRGLERVLELEPPRLLAALDRNPQPGAHGGAEDLGAFDEPEVSQHHLVAEPCALRDFLRVHAGLGHRVVELRRLLDGVQILALEVRDELIQRARSPFSDDAGKNGNAGQPGRPPAALAIDDLVPPSPLQALHQQRLENARLTEAPRQPFERAGIEVLPSLLGVGLQVLEGQHHDRW